MRGLGFKVGLHTGGPYPERLRQLLPLLDWVGLDIKALPEDYPRVTDVPGSGERAWQSLRLLLDAGAALEVRTTPMPGLDGTAYLDTLTARLAAAGVHRYALQQCRPVGAPADLPAPRHLADDDAAVALARRRFPHFTLRAA